MSEREKVQEAINQSISTQGLMLTLLDVRSVVATHRTLDVPLWNEVCRYLDQAIDGPAKELANLVIREELQNERN